MWRAVRNSKCLLCRGCTDVSRLTCDKGADVLDCHREHTFDCFDAVEGYVWREDDVGSREQSLIAKEPFDLLNAFRGALPGLCLTRCIVEVRDDLISDDLVGIP